MIYVAGLQRPIMIVAVFFKILLCVAVFFQTIAFI